MPGRIGLRYPVSPSVVGVDSLRAGRIGHADQVIDRIVGIQRFVPLPVGYGGFITVSVIFIFFHIPQRICLTHQFPGFRILVGICIPQRCCPAGHAA